MANIMIDQFHLSFFVPRDLPERKYDAIHATLDNHDFQTALRRAIRAVIRDHPSLDKVRFTLSG